MPGFREQGLEVACYAAVKSCSGLQAGYRQQRFQIDTPRQAGVATRPHSVASTTKIARRRRTPLARRPLLFVQSGGLKMRFSPTGRRKIRACGGQRDRTDCRAVQTVWGYLEGATMRVARSLNEFLSTHSLLSGCADRWRHERSSIIRSP
jgi:hypothetical protein